MKTVVTGGCGFIGSHIVDELILEGHDVVVIDNMSAEANKDFYKNPNAEYINLDISSESMLMSEDLPEKCHWIFHLAAESRIQPAINNPIHACKVNVMGTCNLLEYAMRSGAQRFIYSSTSAGYGLKNEIPLKETMSRDCLNPYSSSKLAGEDLCGVYYSLYGLPTVAFRYFNVYGDRQPLQGQYAPVVGLFMEMSKRGESMSIVGDGLQRRDFTHVSDVVKANILAAKTEDKSAYGEVFNVGTGTNRSVLEIAQMIGGPYHHISERPGEARDTLADNAKIRRILGWEPTIDIEDWIEQQ
tara:strand:+ start:11022 stop:11921 length:900 start_codon:yes stop_codon:yes gene_type:complete